MMYAHSQSDSEDDADYVPPKEDDSQSSDDERDAKRTRIEVPAATEEDQTKAKQQRDALWAEFKASMSTPRPQPSRSDTPQRMVKIEKRFRFAGEEVVEVHEVPEDSDEAKKWPRWQPPHDNKEKDSAMSTPSEGPSQSSSNASKLASSSAADTTTPRPAVKRAGPRKPKTSLAPLPSAQKAKKLTTLDKSAMDWRAHVQTEDRSGLKDELEANRRGGGYLEKVEFLQRVEERKADALDSHTSKRRRG